MSPTSAPPAPLPWAGSTDLLTPTLPADPCCCEIPHAGRDHRNCQLQGGSGRSEAAQQSYTWWDSCGGSQVGATALQASVPLNPTSSACNWSHFKGGLAPRGCQVCNPQASCPCPGNILLLEQLVLLLWGVALAPGYQAPCTPCCPAGPASQLISPQFPGRRCCCCQLVSHSTGESGCRIPGAQEGRSQDTQRLQQRSSEANIKGGAGAAGLGTAQLRAAGNTHTCISQGRGGEGGGRTAGFPLRPVSL